MGGRQKDRQHPPETHLLEPIVVRKRDNGGGGFAWMLLRPERVLGGREGNEEQRDHSLSRALLRPPHVPALHRITGE